MGWRGEREEWGKRNAKAIFKKKRIKKKNATKSSFLAPYEHHVEKDPLKKGNGPSKRAKRPGPKKAWVQTKGCI